MLRLKNPPSSQQRREGNHRKCAMKFMMHPRVSHLLNTIRRATTAWLFRVFLVITIGCGLTIMVLEVTKDVTFKVWYIELLLIALLGFMLIITMINGKWNEETQCMEVEPVINMLMIGLLLLLAAAYIFDVILEEHSMLPYWEALGVAVAVLVATSLIALMERE